MRSWIYLLLVASCEAASFDPPDAGKLHITCADNAPGECKDLQSETGNMLNCAFSCGPMGKSFLSCNEKTKKCECESALSIVGLSGTCLEMGFPPSSAAFCRLPLEMPPSSNIPATCVYTGTSVLDEPITTPIDLWCCP